MSSRRLDRVMKRFGLFRRSAFIICLLFSCSAMAAEGWRAQLPEMSLVGSGRLQVFFIDIYQLTLVAEDGQYAPGRDFALVFDYLTSVSKASIIDASLDKLADQDRVSAADIKQWRALLNQGIVDMDKGSSAIVIFFKDGRVGFVHGTAAPVMFNAPKFAVKFAAIWLGQKTAYPGLRRQLLGVSQP